LPRQLVHLVGEYFKPRRQQAPNMDWIRVRLLPHDGNNGNTKNDTDSVIRALQAGAVNVLDGDVVVFSNEEDVKEEEEEENQDPEQSPDEQGAQHRLQRPNQHQLQQR